MMPRGATLLEATDLPRRFSLIVGFDRTSFDCELVWAEGNTLGVRFIGAARPGPKPAKLPKKPERKRWWSNWKM
jgi:hypothetical protein